MIGYIYKTTDLLTGKIYVGKRVSRKFNGLSYVGSGTIILRIKAKCLNEGIPLEKRLKVEMLDQADTLDELSKKEIYWIDKLEARNPSVGYNLRKGGDCGPGGPMFKGHKHSLSTREKMSESRKGALNANYGNHRIMPDEEKPKHALVGKRNGMFGKKQTKHSNDLNRKSHQGRRYMTNNALSPKYKSIKPEEIQRHLELGWYFIKKRD